MILVAPDSKYLLNQNHAPSDFTRADGDTLLGDPVFARVRHFPPQIQATFPAVNGVNTIVIGEAEHTADRTSSRWVLTVLHEHFHQLTYTQPGYYAGAGTPSAWRTGIGRACGCSTIRSRAIRCALWQEGVARYTELRLAQLAATSYTPSTDFQSLPDFIPFADVAATIRAGIVRDLDSLSLARNRREVVYSVGAAEANRIALDTRRRDLRPPR
jgi:hypothetical protein